MAGFRGRLLVFVCLSLVPSACRPPSVGPIVLTQRPTSTMAPTLSSIATLTPAPTLLTATILSNDLQSHLSTITPVTEKLADPILHNTDWTPEEKEIGGVGMVKVPAGCFMMGTDEWSDEERPVHRQCLEMPYWIDKYEVTNGQFATFGGEATHQSRWTGNDCPRETISWFEANAYCLKRGARLPTEREWEYAARGPDSLTYPWGNDWDPTKAAWYESANYQTVKVGSYPAGASWVGAQDLSGNVWEWTNTLIRRYPYDAEDGREAGPLSEPDEDVRVLRGGSLWMTSESLMAAYRLNLTSDMTGDQLGFRCARSQ